MKLYVGITDADWFNQISVEKPDELNFWKPGQAGFAAVEPGGLFLFKLHSPQNFIVGGGHFVSFSKLPVSIAWEAFGRKNGVDNLEAFRQRIRKYRNVGADPDPVIGCVILNAPFFFARHQWIPAPEDWAKSIVQGKSFNISQPDGQRLFAAVQERLQGSEVPPLMVAEQRAPYGEPYLAYARLGQGAFRVLVTDAYERRCAITGERTLPVLQAAHIVPYHVQQQHRIDNGLLLRADLHILYDQGLITVTPDHVVEVSDKIRERFENGRDYYAFRGQQLRVLPRKPHERPNPEHLQWHREQLFVA